LAGSGGPHWPDGRYRLPEITASGVGLFDADGDGDLDIYLVCYPPPDQPEAPAPNRLFRQLPDGRFEEVAGAAGLDDPGYGNGVALGDYDDDGDLDVYVANLGADGLYRNDGGVFANATASAGIVESEWSSCAAFFDHDQDGDLDLFVTHYLVDDPARVCRPGVNERQDYCGPTRYRGVADLLYENRGGGRFADATARAGIAGAHPGFGVVCADFTGDGLADVYVANDMRPNQLHVNRGKGSFADRGVELGAALNGAGSPEASMGVAVGDLNGDGRLDILSTNLVNQGCALHLSEAAGAASQFRDRSATAGLRAPTLKSTGWGCGLVDLDHDGDLDAVIANGRVSRGPLRPGAALGAFWNDYAEPNLVFLNAGGGRFEDASARGGGFTARVEVAHALAFGDLDRDGDIDLVAGVLGNRVRIFRNDAPPRGHRWLQVRALTGKRDALGAVVSIEAGGKRQMRPILSAYSFQAASEPVAHFGLGTAGKVEKLEVRWPDGTREEFASEGVDRRVTVAKGGGRRQ
jgi:hypothetical protein